MDACPICDGVQAVFYARQDEYNFVACRSCGFVFLFPMPDASSLAAVYDDSAFDVGRYPKAKSRMRRAMMRALRLWPHFVAKDAIDVGCGGGFLAEAMRRLGARTAGLDISAGSIAYASDAFPKVRFFNETFDTFLSRGETYDFIHSSEVIEHIGDVKSYMSFLAGIARPGAKLFLTTPDILHPMVPKDVTDWDMFSPPRHVQFFSESTLTRLLDAYGFEILKRFYKKSAPTLQVMARKREI